MGFMEKKRLLPALIAAVIAASWAPGSPARDSVLLQGIRTNSEETGLVRARKLLGELQRPDMAEAEKTLCAMKNSYPGEKRTEEIMELLSVKPAPAATFPGEGAASRTQEPALFYFFSFSMPRPSLREAAQESAAAGAVMVLRGLSGEDFGETASRIGRLVGKTEAEVWIDPVLFRCFSVGAVPQLVLARGRLPGEDCEELRHVKVSGDVSLPYALGLMEKEDPDAALFIERLAKNSFYDN